MGNSEPTEPTELSFSLRGVLNLAATIGGLLVFAAFVIYSARSSPNEQLKWLVEIPSFVALSLVSSGAALLFVRFAATFFWVPTTVVGSPDEVAAASERSVATIADTLTRNFQKRIEKEIEDAVSRLAATSDQVITTQLAARIDATVGANLVSVLGAQLAKQTSAEHKLSDFKQAALDDFIQMRARAIQYADSARRQSSFFRWTAISLSLGGLGVLGLILYENYQQFLTHPELMQTHAEWTMIILRNGPAYTFVALCEFLALIMFRYQSKSLEYMRYFSNEGTNLDARRIAFMSAIFYADKAAMKKLIEKLESTERNFLIDKNQRTLELANNESEDRVVEKLFARVARSTSLEAEPGENQRSKKKTVIKTT
jgi:hypothetical protein